MSTMNEIGLRDFAYPTNPRFIGAVLKAESLQYTLLHRFDTRPFPEGYKTKACQKGCLEALFGVLALGVLLQSQTRLRRTDQGSPALDNGKVGAWVLLDGFALLALPL